MSFSTNLQTIMDDDRTITGESSRYFQSPSVASNRSDFSTNVATESGFSTSDNPTQRSQSSLSSRTGISRTSTSLSMTRPSTASGRRSRASTTSAILGPSETHDIVCAVSEARGVTPSVGVAFVNVSIGEVILSQICDNQNYVKTIHKIQMMMPSRIIFSSNASLNPRPYGLFSMMKEMMTDSQVDEFDRSAWSESDGLDYISQLAFKSDIAPIRVAIQGKFYATTAFSAAMQFIEQNFGIKFANNSLRISYQPSDETMMIDISAFQSLEIMQNSHNPKSKSSLLGLLDYTLTPMGSRMLRSNILQPPTNKDLFINRRYDALTELTSNEEMFRSVRRALKGLHDVEKLLTKLITIPTSNAVPLVEGQINHILMIKSFLEAMPELHIALSTAESDLLVKAARYCHPGITSPVLKEIREVIEADVTYMKSPLDQRNQRTFAVKAGINGMLDVARQGYKELTEEIHQHVDDINDEMRLGVQLKYDNGRKYWLRIREDNLEGSLPQDFINVVKKKDIFECQTLSLVKLNARLSDISNEVVMRSDKVLHDLVKTLRGYASTLFNVCESVAIVDMLSSFAQLASTRDYVRPEITETLALRNARHPILDRDMSMSFVPNDYYSSAREHCFHIITGCNMSGKSTYIKAVSLLQIMAQIGSFVPADYASFPIIHQIFARISKDDNIEANLSSFSLEMREMAFILKNIGEKSLAIIDELGRGTSTRDGLAIAIAISEALIQSRASVWFATHFIELARVLADRPGVLNLHLAAKSSFTETGLPKLTMLYKVTGKAMDEDQHYGIHLARAIGLPQTFIEKAEEVAKDLRQKRQANQQRSESRKLMQRRQLIRALHESLKQARHSESDSVLSGYLQRLQQEFVVRMEEIDNM